MSTSNTTAPLTFFTNPMSRARSTRWMLEETGLPYETVVLDFASTMKAPDFLAVNPMGKVPAIKHGDTVVTENAAIALYLGDLVPELGLAPPVGSPERGAYYRWLLFLAGPLEAVLTAKSAGALAQPVSAGYGSEKDVLDTLEALLTDRDHIAGSQFTMADLYMASYLGFYMQFKMLEERPAFKRYVDLHTRRPAQLRATALDDALMPKQG